MLRTTRPGVLAAIAAITALVAGQQFGGIGRNDLLGSALTNSLHVPLFALIALLVARITPQPRRVFAICVGLALVTEIIQIPGQRSASLIDLALDLIGAGLVCLGLSLSQHRWWVAVGVALTLVTVAAPALILAAYLTRDAAFPVIFDPGARLLDPLWSSNSEVRRISAPDAAPFTAVTVLEVVWSRERYPGVTVVEAVADWHAYDLLEVEVLLPEGPPMALTAAVGHEGLEGTAAHQRLFVEPGYQALRYSVPALLKGPATVPKISKLILHTDATSAGRRLLIGKVRLVRPDQTSASPDVGRARSTLAPVWPNMVRR